MGCLLAALIDTGGVRFFVVFVFAFYYNGVYVDDRCYIDLT